MNVKEVADMYGVDRNELERYVINQSEIQYQKGFLGLGTEILGSDAGILIANFKQAQERFAAERAVEDARRAKERAAENARLKRERDEAQRRAAQKPLALANMLISSGFNFDGYTITKYSGYISGDDVVQIDRGNEGVFFKATNVGEALMSSLVKIRRNALAELKEAAYALGCNAIIGVDFDYLILDPETSAGGLIRERRTAYLPYVFGVTANGNAVIIEKNKTAGNA